MSANLPPTSHSTPGHRGVSASALDLASALSGSGAGAPPGQDFASWMAQHRDSVKPAQPSLPQRPTMAFKAPMHEMPEQAMMAPPASKIKAPLAQRSNKAVEPTGNKLAAGKPTDVNKASANAGKEEAQEASSHDGQEVKFKTAHGEATTWVRELQPPPELPASDPAAMLAWLASLTQADAASEALTMPGTEANGMGAKTAADANGRPTTANTPLATNALQMAGLREALTMNDAGGAAGSGADQGQHPQDTEQGSIEFSALMSRETARASNTTGGVDASRHYTGSLGAPVESPRFAQALADRVGLWISGPAQNGPMTAELRLNPAEMGPVHIRIELDGQTAMVDFAAANAQTREAIEASLPLLSGALEDVGLSLTGGGVSDQGPGQQQWAGQAEARSQAQGGPSEGRGTSQAGGAIRDQGDPLRAESRSADRPGGLDLYA